ncbi:hypothetical protein Tco_0474726 [Tanacetum coccineum]
MHLIPHRFVDPYPVRTLRDSEAYHRWRAAPLSIVYPPTTFETLSRDFSSDSLTSSSERPPHSSATHSSIPSPALSPARADLLPPRKRIRGFSVASSLEGSSKGSMEAIADDEIRVETEVRLKRDDEAKDEAESSARVTIEIGVDRVVEPEMPADNLVPRFANIEEEYRTYEIRALADDRERTRLRERVSELEGSIMRLRRALVEERERVDNAWCCMSENGDDNENGNGGGRRNGNGGHGNGGNVNAGRTGIAARECTYKEFLNCQPFNFKGTEGAVRSTVLEMRSRRWRMVVEEEDRVGRYIWGLPDNIQGNVTSSVPTRLQDVVRIANSLMD